MGKLFDEFNKHFKTLTDEQKQDEYVQIKRQITMTKENHVNKLEKRIDGYMTDDLIRKIYNDNDEITYRDYVRFTDDHTLFFDWLRRNDISSEEIEEYVSDVSNGLTPLYLNDYIDAEKDGRLFVNLEDDGLCWVVETENGKTQYKEDIVVFNNSEVNVVVQQGYLHDFELKSMSLTFEDLLIKPKENVYCPHCGAALFVSDLPYYDYVCYDCDENFDIEEVLTKEECMSRFPDAFKEDKQENVENTENNENEEQKEPKTLMDFAKRDYYKKVDYYNKSFLHYPIAFEEFLEIFTAGADCNFWSQSK